MLAEAPLCYLLLVIRGTSFCQVKIVSFDKFSFHLLNFIVLHYINVFLVLGESQSFSYCFVDNDITSFSFGETCYMHLKILLL
uniref:Uncharacterized protein n=1 Tax=Arundo donax TaxID=35708 RepID=A0A0A9F9Y0_ARUDO